MALAPSIALREVDISIPDKGFFADAGSDRTFLPEGSVMDLSVLRKALSPIRGAETFFPPLLYIREEMEQAAKEILENGNTNLTVLSGSPGIGKSLVCFLLTLFKVWKRLADAAIYLRHHEDTGESTSVFVMTLNDNGSIKIRFNRDDIEFDYMTRNLESTFIEMKSYGEYVAYDKFFTVLDGPPCAAYRDLKDLTLWCTSRGGIRLKSCNVGHTFNVVMGAWKKETLEAAVRKMLKKDGIQMPFQRSETEQVDFDSIFERVFFYRGGRMRYFYSTFKSLLQNDEIQVDTRLEDTTVTRVSKHVGSLVLSVSDCRSEGIYVDSLRSIFRKQGGDPDQVEMHVDSRYKIEGEELFESYKKAERQSNSGAMANYFEELMHWCLSRSDELSLRVLDSIWSSGTGAEGLAKFTRRNVYWISSIPNFASIDSAIVDSQGALWCFQFTKGTKYTYKSRRFKSQFLLGLPHELNCNKEAATIFYLVPNAASFKEFSKGAFSDADAKIRSINCDSLASVCKDAEDLVAAHVAQCCCQGSLE